MNDHGITLAMHSGDAGHSFLADYWGVNAEFEAFRQNAFKTLLTHSPISDALASLIAEGVLSEHRNLRVCTIETGSEWVQPLLKFEKTYKMQRHAFAEDPIEVFARQWVSPYYEDDLHDLKAKVGADHMLFGSDWPYRRFRNPVDFVADLDGFNSAEVEQIMRTNGLALAAQAADLVGSAAMLPFTSTLSVSRFTSSPSASGSAASSWSLLRAGPARGRIRRAPPVARRFGSGVAGVRPCRRHRHLEHPDAAERAVVRVQRHARGQALARCRFRRGRSSISRRHRRCAQGHRGAGVGVGARHSGARRDADQRSGRGRRRCRSLRLGRHDFRLQRVSRPRVGSWWSMMCGSSRSSARGFPVRPRLDRDPAQA